MSKQFNIGGFFLTAFIVILLIFIGFIRIKTDNPKTAYMVYLDEKKIGLIASKDELYDLIDKEQNNIKKSFGVEKVYPPENLETVEYTTYNENYKTAEEIYDLIEEESTFTIKGYTVTIKPEGKDIITINILNKDFLEPALRDAISAFVSLDELDLYLNDNQLEITDTGKIIENIYFEEKITIKESYLSVDDEIISNEEDLTKYLLFGTLDSQKEYVVKDGDTLESIALNNRLSNQELLIANPNLSSINSILSEGQVLNIGLIAPLFTVIEVAEIVEDVEMPYDIVTETDSSLYNDQSYVKQEGVKGVNRTTENITYKNGTIDHVDITNSDEISAPIKQINVKGTKPSYNFSNLPPAASSTDWGWPTSSPYVITSFYGFRWGRHHDGIDISGPRGMPIFSSTDGTVVKVNKSCPNGGYYGSTCGGGFGNNIEIKSSSGYTIYYAHMNNDIKVSEGQTISKGQRLGTMGTSGSSTGYHLHFEIRTEGGEKLNPCKAAFAC